MRRGGKAKILFILAQYRGVSDAMKMRRWAPRTFSFYPLNIPILGALTPETSFTMEFINEYWGEQVDFHSDADLVAISFVTPSARRAYEVADKFRERGKPVVMGGVHASVCAEEAARHADVIIAGEAEETWPRFLEDFLAGAVKPRYDATRPVPPELIPLPNRGLAKRPWKLHNISMMATRGCPFGCDFCAVSNFFGKKVRCRPVDLVIQDLEAALALEEQQTRLVALKDDNLAFNRDYAGTLFERLIPLNLQWAGQTNIKSLDDPELVDLMAKSGAALITVGLESVKPANIARYHKSYEEAARVKEVIARLHRHNIFVWGSYMIGFDDDTPESLEATYRQAKYLNLDLATFNLLTPFPGTDLYHRLAAEGRLVEKRWEYYDVEHSVFKPLLMSQEELTRQAHQIIRRFYSGGEISHRMALSVWRMLKSRRLAPLSYIFFFNLAARAIARKL